MTDEQFKRLEDLLVTVIQSNAVIAYLLAKRNAQLSGNEQDNNSFTWNMIESIFDDYSPYLSEKDKD